MDLSSLSVKETADFVSQKLKMPDLAAMFVEQDVDGLTMLDLTASTIREYLPSVTMGKCHRFFRSLKAYQKEHIAAVTPPRSPSSPPRSPSPPPEFCLELEGPFTPPPPSRRTTLLAPNVRTLDQSAGHDHQPQTAPEVIVDSRLGLPPASPDRAAAAVPQLSRSPVPKDFPIEKAVFSQEGLIMINTGNYTVRGKTSITNAVVMLIQKYSTSPGYASYALRLMAATALVYKYPTLELGMGVSSAVKSWHCAFKEKLKNWRKRDKIVDPKMEEMKRKYNKHARSPRLPLESPKRRRTTFNGRLTEEEAQEQEEHRQIILSELQKPMRERNVRLLDLETEASFLLRRHYVLTESPHAHSLMKEWPSLRIECIILKELCYIHPMANTFAAFNAKLLSILPNLMIEMRFKANLLQRNHPLSTLVEEIPLREPDDIDYDIDLNIMGVLAGLAYVLPTTAKKTAQPHRYLVDISAVNATKEDIKNAVVDRHQPYLQVFGSLTNRQKVVVYADKSPICQCSSIIKAVYLMMSAYYILDVEYPPAVATALEFLQLVGLGLPSKKTHVRAMELVRRVSV